MPLAAQLIDTAAIGSGTDGTDTDADALDAKASNTTANVVTRLKTCRVGNA
jgi:hypothetical protein